MALTKIKTGGIADNAVTDAKVADNITAGTATTLATARTINGVSFDGSANITVTADANTLSNTTLKSTVVNSSLTSVGTLGSLTTSGSTGSNYIGSFTNTSATGWGLFVKGGADNADYTLRVQDKDAADLLSVKSGGRVGVLTNDPSHSMVIKTHSSGSVNAFKIEEKDSTDALVHASFANSHDEGSIGVYYGGNLKNYFRGNGASYITGGSLGIGETAPLATLHVKEGDSGLSSLNGSGTNLFLEANGANAAGMTIASGNTANGFIIFGDSDSNFRGAIQYDHSAPDKMHLTTAGSQRLSIDQNGKVGVGLTDPASLLHVKTTANVSETIRIQNDDSLTTMGVSSDGYSFHTYQHKLYTASWDGSSWSTKGQIDGNGNQIIGTGDRQYDWGSERRSLTIKSVDNASANNYAVLEIVGHSINNDGALGAIHFYDHGSSNASIQANRQNNSGSAKLMFSTSESGGSKKARMTIYDAGSVLIDNDNNGSPAQLTIQNDGSSGWLGTWLVLNSKNHSNRGAGVTMHNQAADKGFFTGCRYLSGFDRWSICFEGRNYADQSTADSDHEVLHVNYDGSAYNDQNTWGSSSDERIKNSIVDSKSQWDDIKSLKIKNYKLTKHGEDAPTLIGVIAQDLEKSGMNGLIDETEADELQIARYKDINEGDKIKSVKYSVLYMKAIKALQEAMEKIETLETKVEALENA